MADQCGHCCVPFSPYNDPTAKVSRVEPKTFLANERTFINWLSMSVKIGGVASALAAFGVQADETEAFQSATRMVASFLILAARTPFMRGALYGPDIVLAAKRRLLLTALTKAAIGFCCYAMYTFFWRRRRIRRKDDTIDDPYGPLAMATVLIVALGSAFVSAATRLYGNTYVQETFLLAPPNLPE